MIGFGSASTPPPVMTGYQIPVIPCPAGQNFVGGMVATQADWAGMPLSQQQSIACVLPLSQTQAQFQAQKARQQDTKILLIWGFGAAIGLYEINEGNTMLGLVAIGAGFFLGVLADL